MKNNLSIIQDKINGNSHTDNEIRLLVNEYNSGKINDDDMTAWLKAVKKHGMNKNEVSTYTDAVICTGEKMNFSNMSGRVIDKHSTGGVGDKVSLILGPMLAANECFLPMIVGKSLGHTGGTLDKLCSIPGYQPYLNKNKFDAIVRDVGISIIGQTDYLCPVDKKLYALRDKSNTIDSYPLICGSIMSKKIAEGIDHLVLDIKTGNGAFMDTIEKAVTLGNLLSEIGEQNNIKVDYVITDMNQPLGQYAGVGCEVIESINALKGNYQNDLMDVILHIGQKLLYDLENKISSKKLLNSISNGMAFEKFNAMINAHGGSLNKFYSLRYENPKYSHTIKAQRSGYITCIDTLSIGNGIVMLGGGRMGENDVIDNYAGIKFYKKINEEIKNGDPIADIFCSSNEKLNSALPLIKNAITLSQEKVMSPKLIYK